MAARRASPRALHAIPGVWRVIAVCGLAAVVAPRAPLRATCKRARGDVHPADPAADAASRSARRAVIGVRVESSQPFAMAIALSDAYYPGAACASTGPRHRRAPRPPTSTSRSSGATPLPVMPAVEGWPAPATTGPPGSPRSRRRRCALRRRLRRQHALRLRRCRSHEPLATPRTSAVSLVRVVGGAPRAGSAAKAATGHSDIAYHDWTTSADFASGTANGVTTTGDALAFGVADRLGDLRRPGLRLPGRRLLDRDVDVALHEPGSA